VTDDDLRPFNAAFGTPKLAAEMMAAADRVVTF
jgi:hypothetical protein